MPAADRSERPVRLRSGRTSRSDTGSAARFPDRKRAYTSEFRPDRGTDGFFFPAGGSGCKLSSRACTPAGRGSSPAAPLVRCPRSVRLRSMACACPVRSGLRVGGTLFCSAAFPCEQSGAGRQRLPRRRDPPRLAAGAGTGRTGGPASTACPLPRMWGGGRDRDQNSRPASGRCRIDPAPAGRTLTGRAGNRPAAACRGQGAGGRGIRPGPVPGRPFRGAGASGAGAENEWMVLKRRWAIWPV